MLACNISRVFYKSIIFVTTQNGMVRWFITFYLCARCDEDNIFVFVPIFSKVQIFISPMYVMYVNVLKGEKGNTSLLIS